LSEARLILLSTVVSPSTLAYAIDNSMILQHLCIALTYVGVILILYSTWIIDTVRKQAVVDGEPHFCVYCCSRKSYVSETPRGCKNLVLVFVLVSVFVF